MQYSVQPDEIVGFIYFLTRTTQEQQQAWLEKYPELKKTNFEHLLTENRQKSGPSLARLFNFIEDIKDVTTLYDILDDYPDKNVDINKMKETVKSVWPIYHSFYQQNAKELRHCAKQADKFMNNTAIESLKNVAQFYNYDMPSNYTVKTCMIPIICDEKGKSKRGGENVNNGQMELIWFGDTYLKSNPEPPYWMIFHEATHAIFNKSGSGDKSSHHFTDDSPITRCFANNPQLKRSQNQSEKNATSWILDEGLTTAFQGIFEEDVLHQKRKSLYGNPVIDTIAHKMMPILREAIKTGETFGPAFLKKFEKEFESAIPEMLALKGKAPLSRLSNASKEGKDDPRDETKTPQVNPEKRPVLPSQKKDPSRL